MKLTTRLDKCSTILFHSGIADSCERQLDSNPYQCILCCKTEICCGGGVAWPITAMGAYTEGLPLQSTQKYLAWQQNYSYCANSTMKTLARLVDAQPQSFQMPQISCFPTSTCYFFVACIGKNARCRRGGGGVGLGLGASKALCEPGWWTSLGAF